MTIQFADMDTTVREVSIHSMKKELSCPQCKSVVSDLYFPDALPRPLPGRTESRPAVCIDCYRSVRSGGEA